MLTSNITTQLYQQHHETVVRWATKLTRSRDIAEDVAQDVFMVVERRKAILSEIDNPVGWLRRITTNLVRHHWRNARKYARQSDVGEVQIADGALDPHQTLEHRRDVDLVSRALETLNPEQRALVLTADEEESQPRASGGCASVRPETLRVRRFRARSLVAKRVRELEARSTAHTQPSRRNRSSIAAAPTTLQTQGL